MAPPNGSVPPPKKPTVSSPGARAAVTRDAGSTPLLRVKKGPAEGTDFPLEADEIVIGRSPDNAVSLPDTAVSRKHTLIRKTPTGWLVSDMGSGNGTLKNGEPIVEETPLVHGDVLSLGDSELELVDARSRAVVPRRSAPGGDRSRPVVRSSRMRQALEQEEAQTRRRRNLLIATLMVTIAAGAAAAYKWQAELKALADTDRGRKQAAERKLGELKEQCKRNVKDRKWEEAKTCFQEVAAQAPNDAATALALERIEKEIPSQAAMDAANDALEKGDLKTAVEQLALVASDTIMFERKAQLFAKLDKQVKERLEKVRAMLPLAATPEALDEVEKIVDDVLAAQKGNREALNDKAAIDAARKSKRPAKTGGGDGRPKDDGPKPWSEVQEKFRAGDLSLAYAKAEECAGKFDRCNAMKRDINDFKLRFSRLEQLSSPQELIKLCNLEQSISGGGASKFGRDIGTRMGSVLIPKMSAEKSKENWSGAIEIAQMILKCDPTNVAASGVASEGSRKAKDIYYAAYGKEKDDRDLEEAARLYKQVLSVSKPGDEWYDKAKDRLAKLR